MTQKLPANRPTTGTRLAPDPPKAPDLQSPDCSGSRDRPRSAALLSISCSTAPTARWLHNGGVAKSHRNPLAAFLRPQRVVPQGHSTSHRRVCFTPTTLMSFRLQGFDPSGDQAGVSALLPPVPFVPASGRGSELRRVDPSGSRSFAPKRCAPSPHDVFPLGFSLSPRWGTASRPLLSRAFDLRAR